LKYLVQVKGLSAKGWTALVPFTYRYPMNQELREKLEAYRARLDELRGFL
jgi:hypothetical protein